MHRTISLFPKYRGSSASDCSLCLAREPNALKFRRGSSAALMLYILSLVFMGFAPIMTFSAVLPAALPEKILAPAPISLNNKTTIERLFKRTLSCTFNSGLNTLCPNAAYCCWKFEAGADNPNHLNGGFCCTDDQVTGGGCCGNSCCPYGQYCAYADSLGNYKCIPDASTGSGYPTIYSTRTVTTTLTLTNTITSTDTLTTTIFNTVTVTQHQTNIQTQISIQDYTSIQVTTAFQTSLQTTTNSIGQTIIQTLTSASIVVAGSAETGAAVGTYTPSGGTQIGPIIGGAIGGFALLALLGVGLFTGIRRGWFEKRRPDSSNPSSAQTLPKLELEHMSPQQQEQRMSSSQTAAYEAAGRFHDRFNHMPASY